MAKLNYQKLAVQQQHDRNRSKANKHESAKRLEKVWQLGTHYGKKLHELPLQYLIWVSETFKENDYHKLKADAELIRRHTNLIHQEQNPGSPKTSAYKRNPKNYWGHKLPKKLTKAQ